MTPVSASEDVGALWLVTLQRAVARASHDVKDALNGVSVNLEVIRSRAARPDTPASAVAPFGESAGQQLERLTTLIEAVLALSRPERTPADVGLILRQAVTMCGASTTAADASVRVCDDGSAGPTITGVRGDVVRLAITAPLLDVVTAPDGSRTRGEVTCSLGGDGECIEVAIASGDRRLAMPEGIAELVRASGVRWTEGDRGLLLAFPRA